MIKQKVVQVKNGKWLEFNKHAVLIAEGVYVNNHKHGAWREYYDHTGTIMIEENYQHGIQHGPYTSFHPNGQVLSQGNFVNGLREGLFRVYDEHGKNTRNLFFVKNEEIDGMVELIAAAKSQAPQGSRKSPKNNQRCQQE
jgi:antitoxin component YwqK of YwqJK toxin-antitoxin module